MKFTVPQIVSMLEQYIVGEPTLLSYAENDLANLKELVNEFARDIYVSCNDDDLKSPETMLTWAISEIIFHDNLKNYIKDNIAGYCYLIRSHIRFYQNEQT